MLTGDVGRTAVLARDGPPRRRQLALFHPLKFMLASPAEDAAEIMAAWAPRSGSRTSTTASAPSSIALGRRSASSAATCTTSAASSRRSWRARRDCDWDGILDGELLAYRDGGVLPFLALQTRLGRKSPSAAIRAQVPVIFVAFDCCLARVGGGAERRTRRAAAASRPLDRAASSRSSTAARSCRSARRRRPLRACRPLDLGRRPSTSLEAVFDAPAPGATRA